MITRLLVSQFIIILALLSGPLARAQGTAFSYQGFLADSGAPANSSYDLSFSLFNSDHGPGQLGNTVTNSAAAVSNGVFTVLLDFGAGNFSGADRWLEIGVRTNGGGEFVTLNPRQKLSASPYAITAGNLTGVVPSAGISGTYSSAVAFENPANSFAGNGSAITGLNAANISSGVVPLLRGGTGADTASGARVSLGAAVSGANSDITSLSGLSAPLSIGQGGTGAGTASGALLNLEGASLTGSNTFSGVNVFSNAANGFVGRFSGDGSELINLSAANLTGNLPGSQLTGTYSGSVIFNNPTDLFSGSFHGDGSALTGLNASSFASGVVSVDHGGTGADTAAGARGTLGAAASGANSDITSLTGLSTPLSIDQGGTGAGTPSGGLLNLGGASLTAANTFGGVNVLSNAANSFVGGFAGDGSGMSNINATKLIGTLPSSQLAGTYSGTVTFNNPDDSFVGSFSGNGSGLSGLIADNISSGLLPVVHGGTGAGTSSGARGTLGAAASGANSDITSLSGLSTPLSIGQGGTGEGTPSGGLLNLGGASLTAANTFSGVNVLSNAANSFVGGFTGDGSGMSNINATKLIGTLPDSQLAGTYSGTVTFNNLADDFVGNFSGDGSGLSGLIADNISSGLLPVVHGGTGAGTSSGARGTLGAAASGTNSDITSLTGLSTPLSIGQGGTGAGTPSNALLNLGGASLTAANTFSGVNVLSNAANSFVGGFTGDGSGMSNINATKLIGTLPSSQLAGTYSGTVTFNNPDDSFVGSFSGNGSGLSGLIADNISSGLLPVVHGGTGAGTSSGARGTLGAAASGANSDITSLTGLSTPLSIDQGGTGAGTPSNALLNLGGASLTAANTFSGVNVLSNAANSFVGGFTGDGSGMSNINATKLIGTLPDSQLAGTYSGTVTFNNLADDFVGNFSGDGSGLAGLNARNISSGVLPVVHGGTGADTASGARGTLGAAASGANSDITSLSGLSTPLSIGQGGTGAGTPSSALLNLGGASLTASNTFSGVNVLSNAANRFVGSFAGDGSGLGSINASSLTGTLPSAQLAGAYSGSVTFNNPADSFIGAFTGNGSGVSNVNATALAGLSASGFWQVGGNAGTTASANFLGTTDNQPLQLKATGGVGINTNNPAGKALAINGTVGISATNTLEFGSDVTGKQANAGKIGYQTLTPGSLDIVGAGTNTTSRKIKFWTEGGATFNGTGTNAILTITNTVDEQTSMFFAAPFSTWRIGQNKPPDAPGAFDSFFIYQQNAGATRFLITTDGRVGVGTNNPIFPLHLGNGAYCTAGGQWTSVSDRNAKEDFEAIQPRDVLAKVVALPIAGWGYKAEARGVRHLGPTAQDFHAAFGLGESDRAIGSVDADGVALAAIQGLNQKLEENQTALKQQLEMESVQLKAKQARIEALEQSVAELRQIVLEIQRAQSIARR